MGRWLLTLLGCLGVIIALGFWIFPCRQKDYRLYEELLKSSNPSTQQGLLSYSQQTRAGVRKQIWYQAQTPLSIRIDSDESELFFFKQEHLVEVIEQLEKVVCVMQEELFYEGEKPMQKIRYMEAEKACYNYNSHLFVAERVKLWKYRIEGHTLPETIPSNAERLMRATAKSVEFTLKDDTLAFTAHQMRAVVNSKEQTL